MKNKFFLVFLCLGLAMTSIHLTGCSAGGHIGPVGGGASVG